MSKKIEMLFETFWCVRRKDEPSGKWYWCIGTTDVTRRESLDSMPMSKKDWINLRKAGRVACDRVRMVRVKK